MSTTKDQEIAQLKQHIADATEQTKTYLTSLQGKAEDFDKEHKLSETASSYLQAGFDKANSSVEELKSFGAKIQDNSKEASEDFIKSAKGALANVESSLKDLKDKAADYDEKAAKAASENAASIKTKLSDFADSAKESAYAGFQKIASTLESLQASIAEGASNAGEAIEDAASAASEKAQDAGEAVADKAKEVDQDVSGGAGANLLNKAADLIHDSVEYVSSAFQSKPAADKA